MNQLNTDRIYVADMFSYQASMKAKGLKPYFMENGELKPITVSRCANRWGTIYFLTDAEYTKAQEAEGIIRCMKTNLEKQLELVNELAESNLVNNILNK